MLRRIVLTATASVAALAAAVPAAASASPLPLPLTLLAPADELTVIASETGNKRTTGSYQLKCGPEGGSGTHLAAQAACDRLEELAAEGRDPFAPVPEDRMCTQQYGGPATARITGTWRGRQVDAAFSQGNGCEISRWRNLEPVLPNARS
ncbi:SSI family serine proteinase inhibitor [Streptomyces sp. NBC_01142]|uniref:SSI family serine proteinase inhibitor n=1 Tax=Streptomyces sp. NBC_01142 TaxID=2975865 RepID=UPI002253743F|nr:SSI family serine proteinase inhibitor [Streptomyces sp. NBC_01142]MCX4824209.1 SSI family serine proteinase inhibitor [Streptomyces sp. NBC_01142]